jgi:hypothetical protein
MNVRLLCGVLVTLAVSTLFAQDKDAYSSSDNAKKSGLLLDPSRFTVQNSVSFGAMSSGGNSSLQSQSLYTTMMRYQFAAPVTLNLNFSLPIHSTFSSTQNLTSGNLQSLDYFKSVPFEMSLAWQPAKNMLLQFSIVKPGTNGFYSSGYSGMYHPWNSSRMPLTP